MNSDYKATDVPSALAEQAERRKKDKELMTVIADKIIKEHGETLKKMAEDD